MLACMSVYPSRVRAVSTWVLAQNCVSVCTASWLTLTSGNSSEGVAVAGLLHGVCVLAFLERVAFAGNKIKRLLSLPITRWHGSRRPVVRGFYQRPVGTATFATGPTGR